MTDQADDAAAPVEKATVDVVPPRPPRPYLTLEQFRQLETVLVGRGYASTIAWSEAIAPPENAEEFALQAIYVICNSGMNVVTGTQIYMRCVQALQRHQSSATAFGHPAKVKAIDFIWKDQQALFAAYQAAENKLAFCETLPFIGPVTRFHLAKNLGVDVAKPDVHLERLARAERSTVVAMCQRLADQTGYRVSTIDSILWRACADRYLSSSKYAAAGWHAATEKLRDELAQLDAASL